jgi:hypothetical protein
MPSSCKKHGLPPELRLYAHGQGYDIVERPLIRRDETMAIETGMNLAVHPGYETASIFAVLRQLCGRDRGARSGPAPDRQADLRGLTTWT